MLGNLLACSPLAYSASYPLPPEGYDLVGSLQYTIVPPGDFPIDVARAFDIGQDELLAANPHVRRWLPVSNPNGAHLVIPTRFILPTSERSGLIVNLPEKRLYYFPEVTDLLKASTVLTYPISIGRIDWSTPITNSTVVGRRENPSWYPPESIKIEALERGTLLPDVVPAGPENPLGKHAIYLDLPGYLIHGTSNPKAIGIRATHGCMRLYPEDIKHLFHRIPDGTLVQIIHQSIKTGWHAGELYLEVHTPLAEKRLSNDDLFEQALWLVSQQLDRKPLSKELLHRIRIAVNEKSGNPVHLNPSPIDQLW